MKRAAIGAFALLAFCLELSFGSPGTSGRRSEDVAAGLQAAFNSADQAAYPGLFEPSLRRQEENFRRDLREHLGMERASFFLFPSSTGAEDRSRVFLQVLFENAHSALIQTWDLLLSPEKDGLIIEKKVRTDLGLLYKMSIPSDRVEAASLVEIRHQDIRLLFTDAFVFYDNIPGLETAVLVMGRGVVNYFPSLPREKHQLELATKARSLNKRIHYAFCRVSPAFFRDSIRIVPSGEGRSPALSEAVRTRAAGLFEKHSPRFFTLVNSLSRERLSFLPQDREAVFDFLADGNQEFTYVYSPFAEEEVHFFAEGGKKLINLYSPPDPEGQKKMYISLQEKFDVLHCDIEISVSPKTFQLSARAKLFLKTSRHALDNIKLRLNKDLEIVRVQDDRGRELFTTRDGYRNLLYVYLLEPAVRDTPFSLEIFYRGNLPPPRPTADVLALAQVSETFVLIPPKYESSLYSRSAAWYPAPTEEDFFTARQKIIVPPEHLCVANGRLVERSTLSGSPSVVGLDKAGHAVYVYETRKPVKYLSFIIGDFREEEKSPGPPPLRYIVSADVFPMKKVSTVLAREILAFYERLFGPYPYENLTVVHRLWPVGGGHSPASFIVLNEIPRSLDSRLPANPSSPVDLSRWKEYFLAHEIAHQWWGQGLTWRSYHDLWLSEGLAQFSTVLFLGEKYGERALTGILEKFCQRTNDVSIWGQITLGSRLSYLNYEAFQAIVYNKTAVVLNLLKDIIGPEAFFSGLQAFFRDHLFTEARTSDFRRAMEASSGRDLGLFFKGWFDSHALPQTRVTLSETATGDGRRLEVRVRQTDEVFVFPLWLEWQEGSRRVAHKVVVDDREETFSVPFAGRLRKLKVNPRKIVPGSLRVTR
ncbi:MAG: hypothetical protein JW747_09605 [Candidatus Aminicenantes bacterium]|nr:hypothetical protein [Candidatus Aminicenantes bacterium]